MARRNFNDLQAFVIVAREGSFTRAAALLGITQSALSHSMRNLEERLGIRLLTRTTRSVSTTLAGERLLQSVGQRFDEIEAELQALTDLRDKPAGSVRITCADHVLTSLLLPKLEPLLREYPDIHIEFDICNGLRDIVADRFDAGVRFGEHLDQDMIAVPIGPPDRMAAVATPEYFASHPLPQSPQDLMNHRCLNLRLPTYGGLYAWEFEQDGRELRVRVEGQLIFNSARHIVDAALRGLGIAFLPQSEFDDHIASGRLQRVLEDWCPPFAGYYLYYPSRRQSSPAFRLVMEALREDLPPAT